MGAVTRKEVPKVHLHKGPQYFCPRLYCSNVKQVRVSRRWPEERGGGKALLLRGTDALGLCPQHLPSRVLSFFPHTLLSYGRDRGPQAPGPHTCAFPPVVALCWSCSFSSCETAISNVASLVNTSWTPIPDPSDKVKCDFLKGLMALCSKIVMVGCPLSDFAHCFGITRSLIHRT